MSWLLRLIPLPYLILIAAGLLLLTHGMAGYTGWKVRDNSARAQMQKDAQAAAEKIMLLQTRMREIESAHANALYSVSATYQGKLNEVERDKEKFMSDVRAGRIKLQLPARANMQSVGSTSGQVSAATSGCDGQAGTELPQEVTEFLFGEASRADKIVEQLNACQAIVLQDRKISGAR